MKTLNRILPLMAGSILAVSAAVAAESAEDALLRQAMDDAHQWTEARILGRQARPAATAHLMVYLKSGALMKNRIKDRAFRIVTQQFDRGIAMPSPGEVLVRLAGPGASFEAVVGVDSNDLGYYANTGRGSVVASVDVGGREAFRSGVLHEGLAGAAVKVDLQGAREFSIRLAAVGERSRTYQAEWDQADWANARVKLADGSAVWLADLPVGPLPEPYAADVPFSFRYDGKPSADLLPGWINSRSTRAIDAQRTEYTSTYTDPRTALVVRSVAVAYNDFPAVEWTLYLKNTGAAPTPILEDIQAIDTGFERTRDQEFLLHHSKGSPNSPTDYEPLETPLGPKGELRLSAKGGRPTDTDLCYFNLEWAGKGVIVGLGWPGQWTASFTRDEGTRVQIRAGQELTHFRLLPGEEVRTPLVALVFWDGDWILGQNIWRRWMIAHNLPRPGGKLPPPLLANGSGRATIEMQDANEENQKQLMARDLDAGLKFDYWWMDAGWYPFTAGWWYTGTWEVDPGRFPHGFRPISDAAHGRNAKIIVWFEPERVMPGTWLYEKHPEWLVGPATPGKARLLNLGNPEAWTWLVDHVSQLIREQGIDLYRQDFNFEPLLLWRSNDADDRQGITENKHVAGYLAYWDELRKRFPNMLIDTCASGGRRNDLETLRRSVPLWRSDFPYEPTAMQGFTYGMSLWMPYFGTGVNALEPYLFRSQMTPAVGIGLEPVKFEDGIKRMNHLTGQWREVAKYYYGDFYPLTPFHTETTEWMAWQFGLRDEQSGMIQAFRRPDSSFESARFELRGLDQAAGYVVTDIDSGEERRMRGSDLMEQGLLVAIKNKPGAVILTYRRDKR